MLYDAYVLKRSHRQTPFDLADGVFVPLEELHGSYEGMTSMLASMEAMWSSLAGSLEPGAAVAAAVDRLERDLETQHPRNTGVTRDCIRSVAHLPMHTAAQELGICMTMLKLAARKLGIRRWPARTLQTVDLLEKSGLINARQAQSAWDRVLDGRLTKIGDDPGLVLAQSTLYKMLRQTQHDGAPEHKEKKRPGDDEEFFPSTRARKRAEKRFKGASI